MALLLTLEQDGEDYDVILYKKQGDDDAMEIIGVDIEAAVAGEALGIDPPSSLWLWQHYRRHGLNGFIHHFPVQLHDAFEAQGYDVFSDESYDRSEFLQEVSSNLQSVEEGKISENIEVLEYAVEQGEYDKEEFINDLIEALKTAADSDWMQHDEEDVVILQKLVYLLPADAFKLVVEPSDKDEAEVDITYWSLNYSATINDEEVMSWSRSLNVLIRDPISLDVEVSDPCDNDPESCPPPLACELMDMMGWYYPEPDIEMPDIPESVYGGEWGVQYVRHETERIEGSYYERKRTGEVLETQVVEYETKGDAMEAAELSSNIFSSHGSEIDYDINIVRWDEDAQEWVLVERVR
jgi:hypothetical protein